MSHEPTGCVAIHGRELGSWCLQGRPNRKGSSRISLDREDVTSKAQVMDFPGGAVVKNPPANAGDTGSSPGPESSHMPRSN